MELSSPLHRRSSPPAAFPFSLLDSNSHCVHSFYEIMVQNLIEFYVVIPLHKNLTTFIAWTSINRQK